MFETLTNFKANGSNGYQCKIKFYLWYKQCKLPVWPEEVSSASSRYTDVRRSWISWSSDRRKQSGRKRGEKQEGWLGKGRLDPSVPALARWEGSGIRRGGKRREPAVFDGCVTGRSPYDPVSVVSSAAARAKKETLAYTRWQLSFINATYYVTCFCFLHSDRIACWTYCQSSVCLDISEFWVLDLFKAT